MVGPCKYNCDNKTDLGYCKTTACINPKHNGLTETLTMADSSGMLYLSRSVVHGPPTRICSICNKAEDPAATTAYSWSWICPDCAARLRLLMHSEDPDYGMGNNA